MQDLDGSIRRKLERKQLNSGKTVVICCRTLEAEFLNAYTACKCNYEIHWLESGLHNTPNKMTLVLQKLLDEVDDANLVLLSLGFCGNVLRGLHTRNYDLIIPRVDDCISLLMGSFEKKKEYPGSKSTYFISEGWLKGERNIWVEYQYTLNKYGSVQGEEIFQMMFGNYDNIGVLDTKCYALEKILPETLKIAEALHLKHSIIPVTNVYLFKLLSGPWPRKEFVTISRNSTVVDEDLRIEIFE